jgi:ABC-2 type transport system ATP-binding protein
VARVTGRIAQFPTHSALDVETTLTQIREAGLHAEDVEIGQADLEEVFLQVMSQQGQSRTEGAQALATTSGAAA